MLGLVFARPAGVGTDRRPIVTERAGKLMGRAERLLKTIGAVPVLGTTLFLFTDAIDVVQDMARPGRMAA